eukprot:GHUV01052675.1.p1 GENE.GHUV01052675.1~~GHUV01052675.1.p1  ORF type:complete len:100 (-),score=13.00 GHUV01052675.1:45-344(-)
MPGYTKVSYSRVPSPFLLTHSRLWLDSWSVMHQRSQSTYVLLTAASHADGNSSARPQRTRPLDALLSLRKSWALINSSTLFKRLALCMAIVGIVSEVGG